MNPLMTPLDTNNPDFSMQWNEHGGGTNVLGYYCGIDFKPILSISVKSINRTLMNAFEYKLIGVALPIRPGHMAVIIHRDNIGDNSWVVTGYYVATTSPPKFLTIQFSSYATSRLHPIANEGFSLDIKGGGERSLINIAGTDADVDQELSVRLDSGWFHLGLNPIPVPDPLGEEHEN